MNQAPDEKVRAAVAEARARIGSVAEPARRWNRVEEALDAACEEAIHVLDRIGRFDQANEINSHMNVLERFEQLLELYRRDAAPLAREAAAAASAEEFGYCSRLLPALAVVVAEERPPRA